MDAVWRGKAIRSTKPGMLYWAEGARGRNTIKFTNSDPQMLLFFRRFLTDAIGPAHLRRNFRSTWASKSLAGSTARPTELGHYRHHLVTPP